MFFISKIFKSKSIKSRTVNQWLDEYVKILAERELKPKTREIKAYMIKVVRNEIGNKFVTKIIPSDISK